MKLKTEEEKQMWRDAFCAALTGILATGHSPNQVASKNASGMANHAVERWQDAAKADDE